MTAGTAEARKDTVVSKIVRAAKLDVPLYQELEADKRATGQALLVVVVASIAAGIGTGLSSLTRGVPGFSGGSW